MGKNTRRRRAAQRRPRATSPAGNVDPNDAGSRGGPTRADEHVEPPDDHDLRIARLIALGADEAFGQRVDQGAVDDIVQSLVVAQSIGAQRLPDRFATKALLELVGAAWESGWQPLDLVHIVRRHQGSRGAALITAAISEQARRDLAVERAPDDWVAQLASLGADVTPGTVTPGSGSGQWLVTEWLANQGTVAWDGWCDVLRLIGQLGRLLRITPLGPSPSAWDDANKAHSRAARPRSNAVPAAHHDRAGHDPRMLNKIRALLSKAEATTFAEEADAFTSKAQDLMTRYAIDEALLEDAEGHSEVIARRIHIDNPYAQAKVQLLNTVGSVNRVRVIWDDHHGMATAVGMAVDLQLVDMLFTSLLVQATRALTEAGNARPSEPGYRSGRLNRSPSFRRAFLLAYANRIGERLATAGDHATEDARSGHGAELVPVLARRAQQVDTTFDQLFPEAREVRAKTVDARGWHAGRAAADQAVFASAQVEGG